MTPPTITYRYRRPGKSTATFEQSLVLDRPDAKVLLHEPYGGAVLRAGDAVILEPGAPIVWYVFPERWHDVGRFHLADGTFTGFYTNLTTPPEIDGRSWSATDLMLDLWQPAAGGSPVWLDEAELADAVKRKIIDTATRKRIDNERAIIELQLRQGAWPPAIVRDIDLKQVRALSEHA